MIGRMFPSVQYFPLRRYKRGCATGSLYAYWLFAPRTLVASVPKPSSSRPSPCVRAGTCRRLSPQLHPPISSSPSDIPSHLHRVPFPSPPATICCMQTVTVGPHGGHSHKGSVSPQSRTSSFPPQQAVNLPELVPSYLVVPFLVHLCYLRTPEQRSPNITPKYILIHSCWPTP